MSTKKNIFIFWTIRLTLERGGVHRVIALMFEHLPKYGHDVHYMYTVDNYKSFYHYEADGGDEEHISLTELRDYLVRHYCDIILSEDAGYSHTMSDIVKKMALPNVKYVIQYHTSVQLMEKVMDRYYYRFSICHAPSFKLKIVGLLKYVTYPYWQIRAQQFSANLFRENYAVADKVVMLSKQELPSVRQIIGHEASKCTYINNPLSWVKIEEASILDNKQKEVLVVSRIYNPEKRIDRAIKVWRILEDRGYTDWSLKIVGSGVHEEFLKDMTRKLCLKNVSWEGSQVPYPYYLSASIFMMTSACEGWGLTLTESMQTGTVPIVFDSYLAVHDIITDDYDGCIVVDDDIRGYADKVEWLMTHDEERKRIALNGLESCKRFTIGNIMKQWADMLNSI